MQVKNQGVNQRARISHGEIGKSTKTVERKPVEQAKVRLREPDPKQSVAKGTAQDFVKSSSGDRTGSSPLEVRFESQQEMNLNAHQAYEKSAQAMVKLERGYSKPFEPEDKADFRAEQKAFEKFMTAQATLEGNLEARGGSLMPLVYSGVAKDLVEQRTKLMQERIANGSSGYHGTSTMTDAPQQEMNAAAWEAFGATDDRLSTLCERIAGKLEGEDLAEFNAASKAFGEYREALSEFEANREARGGTLAPLIKASVADGMTLERIDQLTTFAEQHGWAIGESQQEMNLDAHQAYETASKALGRLEQSYGKDFELEDRADFKAEQGAFEKFVEAQATFAGNLEARGGSLMPLIYAGEAKQLVEERSAVMQDRLETGYTKFHGSSEVTDAPQQVMNQAAWEAFGVTDDKLTALTEKIAQKLEGEDLAEFKAANKAFGDYREALSTMEANREARGGTLAPLIQANVAEGMTAQRIDQLKPLLEQLGA